MNTDKPKVVALLVFFCTTASFIAQISSSENVLKQDTTLAPVAKQWIAEEGEPIKTRENCYSVSW